MKFAQLALLALLAVSTSSAQQKYWRTVLDERLPAFGHRNWIVIADSAYPLQSAPGIETVVSPDSQFSTIRQVFEALSNARHIRPIVYTDKELQYVPEGDAIGIGAFRQLLGGLFSKYFPGLQVNSIAHQDVIRTLDEASKNFNVLIIKTPGLLAYTSIFLELRAGYWSDEAEQRLRQSVP